MKGINKIDRIDFNNEGNIESIKGHIEPVKIEISGCERIGMNSLSSNISHSFNNHFSKNTLKIMFWSQFELDYIGG